MNHANITQPLNTKLLLIRKLEWLKLKPKCFNDITFGVFQTRNIRWEKIEKKSYLWFQEIKENCHIALLYKIIDTDLKKIMPLWVFPQQTIVPIFYDLCRILNWFCLLYHILRHKNINYAKFSYSNLQLQGYTALRNLQKIKNLIIRHLSRPDF